MRQIDKTWLFRKWIEYLLVLKVDLYSFQGEMSTGLLQLPDYADCTQTRQSGKSFVLGLIIYFLMYVLSWDIIIVAPRLDATEHIMDPVDKIATWMQKHRGVRHSTHSMRKIRISGRGSVKCISGDPFAFVEGSHAHLIVFDEKQDLVKEHISTNIIPFTNFHNGLVWSVGIGGEKGSWGEFSREESARPGNYVWKCPWPRVVIDKPEYQKGVDNARRQMLPPEFAAHYECQELDMSRHILISKIIGYTVLPADKAKITIALDVGSIDKTIATVSHKIGDKYYWHQWKLWSGDYSVQRKSVSNWLRNEVEYDSVLGEYNGVGRAFIDELNGDGCGVIPVNVDQELKNKSARRIMALASDGELKYNTADPLADAFYQDITNVKYEMTSIHNVKVDHSDFYSSGILTLLETPVLGM